MGEALVTALVVLCEVFSSWSLVHSNFLLFFSHRKIFSCSFFDINYSKSA